VSRAGDGIFAAAVSDRSSRWVTSFTAVMTGRPWVVLVASALLAAACLPAALTLQFGGSFTDLFPEDSAPSRAYADFMHRFEAERTLAVVLTGADPGALQEFARRFASLAEADPEIEAVVRGVDLTAVAHLAPAEVLSRAGPEAFPRLRARLEGAGLAAAVDELKSTLTAPIAPPRELLLGDPLGLSRALLEGLDAAQAPVDPLDGTFRSPDGGARLVMLRPRGSSADRAYCQRLLDALDAHAAAARAGLPSEESLHAGYTGSYAYVVGYWHSIQRDVTITSAISLAAVLLLYFGLMRRLRAALLTAAALAAAVPPTFAVAKILFGGFNQISAAAAAIIFGLGIDAGIHLFSRYAEELHRLRLESPPEGARLPPDSPAERLEALRRAMHELLPVTVTGAVATAAILCALGISRFRGLSELGWLTAAGLVLTVAAMLTVLPALIVVAGGAPPPALELRLETWMARVAKRRRAVFAACAAVVLAGLVLLPRVRVEDDPITVVSGHIKAEEVQAELEKRFGVRFRGALLFVERPTLEDALRANDALYGDLLALRARGEAGSVDSLSPIWPAAATRAENLSRFAALDLPGVAARARDTLAAAGLRPAAFQPYLDGLAAAAAAPARAPAAADLEAAPFALQYVRRGGSGAAPGGWLVATWVYPPDGSGRAGEDRLVGTLEKLAATHAASLTGYPVLRTEFTRLLSRDAWVILLLCAAAIAAAVFWHLRDWRAIAATILPLGVAFFAFVAALAVSRVPVSLFTFPVLPLVFGLGFDEHMYLCDRYIAERGNVAMALRGSVRAILLTVLTDVVAFGALGLADFNALRFLGITAAMGGAVCLASALWVMPAFLLWISPRRRSERT
jgi:predicted RND superfamily exporter protein